MFSRRFNIALATVLAALTAQAAPASEPVEARDTQLYECTGAYNGATGRGPGSTYYCTSADWVIVAYVGWGCNLGFGSGVRYCCSGEYFPNDRDKMVGGCFAI